MTYIFTARIGHDVGEKKNALDVSSILEAAEGILGFDGCTTWEAAGYWRGAYEETTAIEICGLDEAAAAALMDRLPELAAALGQTSIYGSIYEGRCEERFSSERMEKRETA